MRGEAVARGQLSGGVAGVPQALSVVGRATSCPRTSHRTVRKVNTRKTLASCSRFSAILAFRGRTPGLRVRPKGTGTQNTSHQVPLAAETQQNRGRLSTLNTVIPFSTQKIQVIYFKTA